MDTLKGRRTQNVGSESLSIQSGRVPTLECKKELEGLVGHVTRVNAMEMGSDYEIGTEEADLEDEY